MRQELWRLGKRAERETCFWVALGAQDRLQARNLQGITDTVSKQTLVSYSLFIHNFLPSEKRDLVAGKAQMIM